MQGYANWGGLVKELGFQIVTSFSHLLHLCDDAFEARQQFFDERSGKPITPCLFSFCFYLGAKVLQYLQTGCLRNFYFVF